MKRTKLTPSQLDALMPAGTEVHTFRNPGPNLLLGADWSRTEILAAAAKHGAELSGETATAAEHGAVLRDDLGLLFIATDPAKLAAFTAAAAPL